ncbi:nucleotidyltransferase family protein [Aureibaculum sp. 2210JD6-5]|uniref:nucleotidyltransferase family protein n=1 Tax=Aureibaculum sp. 2210JD6-5 TaxID=3103957 RepID=UPI002AAC5166|nr:nucleotidyltransferase family protein [Aureibaculum sp. 2210JD6-5]MDY7394148.1 nucleotidyltransferase family protein [Aureibaculum sp. 2210JD6-5]
MQQSSKGKKIAMVILAAGASTRMKTVKQLLPWKNTTLLGHTIEQGLATKVDTVFVVLGANKEKIIPKIKDYNISIIENDDWELGIGKSIAFAVQFLSKYSNKFDSILIALADQPLLTASHYNKLIAKFSESNCGIVATKQDKTVGVPAVFSQNYFEKLSLLNQDKGAKQIIKNNLEDVWAIDAGNTTMDMDTLEDYKQISSTN